MSDERKAWVPISNTDLTEGKGSSVLLGFYESRWDAMVAGKGKGVQGTDCRIEEMTLYRHGARWYGPIDLVKPSREGRYRDEMWREHLAAVEKAKAAGLTADDLDRLKITGGKP